MPSALKEAGQRSDIWVLETVLSSSTHRQDKEKDPVLEEIWNYMSSQKVREGKVALPSSAYEMAKFITDFCIDFFDHSTCQVGPMQESMQEIYKNSINKTVRGEHHLPSIDFLTIIRLGTRHNYSTSSRRKSIKTS